MSRLALTCEMCKSPKPFDTFLGRLLCADCIYVVWEGEFKRRNRSQEEQLAVLRRAVERAMERL